MQYLGNKVRVPLGNGQWSRFMPIYEAEKFAHNLKVQQFLTMLRAGKTVIGLVSGTAAMYEAQGRYQEERGAAANSPAQNAD